MRNDMKILMSVWVYLLTCIVFIGTSSANEINAPIKPWKQWGERYPDWVKPIEPFNIIENVYYVGTEGIASFLITSAAGHVLLDGGLPQNASVIVSNIKTLGFQLSDVKILLNSHAHFDHSGGLSELKKLSAAKMVASKQDKTYLESGLYPGSDNINYSAPPVSVDQQVVDGETISLGPINLKANITPGHSPGCTSWSMSVYVNDKPLEVLFFCSATVAGNRLLNPPQYPGIVSDYRLTFTKTKDWRPDVFLANHSDFFNLKQKRQKQLAGDDLAFVDNATFPKLMSELERKFELALAQQSKGAE
jgi:metallo-beta-lactamase class B